MRNINIREYLIQSTCDQGFKGVSYVFSNGHHFIDIRVYDRHISNTVNKFWETLNYQPNLKGVSKFFHNNVSTWMKNNQADIIEME